VVFVYLNPKYKGNITVKHWEMLLCSQ
jgi:hypothetical protein